MSLHPQSLRLDDGGTITVQVSATGDTTLIECLEPGAFLEHITCGRWNSPLTPDTYLRGCVFQNEGAQFSLCDQFGMVADGIVKLTPEEAQRLILDRLA